jgi:predicted secreted protein
MQGLQIFFPLLPFSLITRQETKDEDAGRSISAPQEAETTPKLRSILEWQDKACSTRRSTA